MACKNPLCYEVTKDYFCKTSIVDYLYHASKALEQNKCLANNLFGIGKDKRAYFSFLSKFDIYLLNDVVKRLNKPGIEDVQHCGFLFFPKVAFKYIDKLNDDHKQALFNLEVAISYEYSFMCNLANHMSQYCNEECCDNYDGELCLARNTYKPD